MRKSSSFDRGAAIMTNVEAKEQVKREAVSRSDHE